MKSSVIIKGNKYGFQIVLNPTLQENRIFWLIQYLKTAD